LGTLLLLAAFFTFRVNPIRHGLTPTPRGYPHAAAKRKEGLTLSQALSVHRDWAVAPVLGTLLVLDALYLSSHAPTPFRCVL